MVWAVHQRLRRHAGTRPSADQRAGAQHAGSRNPDAETDYGARTPPCRRTIFWQTRYYDFNVSTEKKRVEKLRYIHRNPVRRGLVDKPEDWTWSSFRHYATGVEGAVEIESEWTARRRERMGLPLRARIRGQGPTLSPENGDKDGAPTKSML